MNITNDVVYIGINDKKTDLFESQYRIPNGIAYNSYAIIDERIAIMDTADGAFLNEWLDNVRRAIGSRRPDYLIVQHMEPDHSANVMHFLAAYPEARVVASAKAFAMMKGFFGTELEDRRIVVAEGSTLSLGKHELKFISAPMVHWPEVIMTYDSYDKLLFTADAFGKFGTLDCDEPWEDEARRYYIGIVGKYGAQVLKVLEKAKALDIAAICPLHGPVLSERLDHYISLYETWASYRPEEDGVVIAYTSVYGNTKRAVQMLENKLRELGAPKVEVYDLARCDMSEATAAAFRYSHLVLATTTYNADIFPFMRQYIDHLTERGFKNRTVGLIENGSWAPVAAKIMRSMLEECKVSFTDTTVTVKAALDDGSRKDIGALANEICRGWTPKEGKKNDATALFNIGYGLYVVTSNDGERDNGIIVNAVTQVTNSPNRVAVTINKGSYSHHVIKNSGIMNLNCLTTEAPFAVFETFGFKSGRNEDKFKGCTPKRSSNGLAVLPKYTNAYVSLTVERYVDLDTHGMFICAVSEAEVLSDVETMTYTYYLDHVKPKPKTDKVKGYVCKICGYVYEGDELPDDYICPLCKHGKEDFEEIK